MWFDALVLGALVMFAWRGASKGVVWQLATIAAILLCFVFAETLSLAIAPLITVKPPLNRWIAMFALYIGFSFLSFAVARQVRDWIEKAQFVEYDRHLGALLGLVKGTVICLLITFFTVTLSESMRQQVLTSYSGKAAAIVMDRLHPVMPAELHEVLEPYIHRLDHPDLDLEHDHSSLASDDGDDAQSGHGVSLIPVPGGSSGSEQGAGDSRLHNLVRDLIGSTDNQLVSNAVTALRNTSGNDRDELLEILANEAPDMLRVTLASWNKPAEPSPGTQTASQQQQLLKEIAEFYFSYPSSQEVFIEDVQEQLAGLAPSIQLAVLQDLYADLINEGTDPDPGTNHRSTFDTRIRRQVEATRQASTDAFPFN